MTEAVLDGAMLEAGDDVLVLGGGPALVFGAQGRIGDGWVYAVDEVDALEALLGAAHANGVSGVAYLVGDAEVLPLPDASVAAVVGRPLAGGVEPAETARELHRVLRPGGRLSLVARQGVSEATLRAAGFVDVVRVDNAAEPQVIARKS